MEKNEAVERALSILEEAGFESSALKGHGELAVFHLRHAKALYDLELKNQEDEKIREFWRTARVVSNNTSWRVTDEDRRGYYAVKARYGLCKPVHECRDQACLHVDRPRVLEYGSDEPDRQTKWINKDGNYLWAYSDFRGGWYWTAIKDHPIYSHAPKGSSSSGGVSWDMVYRTNFPMTEHTREDEK